MTDIENTNGLILVDKEAGLTSFGVDQKLKKLFHTRKIGHIGTLDPFATGLLPVCVGKGLRFVRFSDGFDKAYRCECVFGRSTDTMDLEGEVTGGRMPSPEELSAMKSDGYSVIRRAFEEISKTVEQLPPKFSAKKINGRRACDLAREGVEVELKPVPVRIDKLDIIGIGEEDGTLKVTFEVYCSKGTYIRELCDRAGSITGFGAYAQSLRRIMNGPFDVGCAYTLGQIEEMAGREDFSFMKDASDILLPMPSIELKNGEAADLKLGKKISCERFDMGEGLYRALFEGSLIAVVYRASEKGRDILRIERMLA